jgi:hypothetical protein
MEAGSAWSKRWIAADGQRVERAGWARGGDLSSPVVLVEHAAWDVGPPDLAGAWLVVAEQWGHKLASPVRARLVVGTEVGAEHRFEVTARVDERWSRQSSRTVLTESSANAFAFGDRIGVRIASMRQL